MRLLEKFRSQPGWQHDDPTVRIEAVRGLPEDDDTDGVLLDVARSDADVRVRRAAVDRITDPDVLISLIQDPGIDASTQRCASNGLREAVIRMNTSDDWSAALVVLNDERDLGAIARVAENESIGLAALERVENDKTIGAVARKAKHIVVALEAVRRLQHLSELMAVAIKADDKAVAMAAYEQLTAQTNVDAASLDEIARRAKQKEVVRRAREAQQADAYNSPGEKEEGSTDQLRVLCEDINQLVQSVSVLDEGRQQLNTLVEKWSMVEGPIDDALADRFASGRRAVEDRLLALDAESVEVMRVADRRSNAESARLELCLRLEGLTGGDSLDQLQVVLKEWASLQAPDRTDRELQLSLASLSERFGAAVEAFEERHRSFLSIREQLKMLEEILNAMERLVATGNSETFDKEWSAIDDQWNAAVATLDSGHSEGATFRALLVRKQNVEAGRQSILDKTKRSQAEKARKNLSRVKQFINSIEAAIENDSLLLPDAERYLRQARQMMQSFPHRPPRGHRYVLDNALG